MIPIYVAFHKELDHGKFLPRFTVLTEPPQHTHRVYKVEPGEYIDAARVSFEDDSMTFTHIELYRVSNIDGQAKQELIESYYMRYVR